MKDTFGEYKEALRKIKEHPSDHGYSAEVYRKVIEFENELMKITSKYIQSISTIATHLPKAIVTFDNIMEEKLADIQFVANHDWLISFNIFEKSCISVMFRILKKKDKDTFEDFVLNVFPEEKQNIFSKIYNKIPHREPILKEIEEGYNRGLYASVVTMCYTQVDGICNEKLNYGFFDVNRDTNDLKIQKIQMDESFSNKIATQLKQPRNEISRYVIPEIRDRTYKTDSFNRHLVLHGHSIYYGTEKNAIRAILLLDFLCELLNIVDQS